MTRGRFLSASGECALFVAVMLVLFVGGWVCLP